MPTKIFTSSFLARYPCFVYSDGGVAVSPAVILNTHTFSFVQITSWTEPSIYGNTNGILFLCKIPLFELLPLLTKEALFVIGVSLNVVSLSTCITRSDYFSALEQHLKEMSNVSDIVAVFRSVERLSERPIKKKRKFSSGVDRKSVV